MNTLNRQLHEYAKVIIDDNGIARPRWAVSHPLLQHYFDTEWGHPIVDEHGLFERLSLEAFQAGLSWLTVLKKRPAFREAFANFDPDRVVEFDENDVQRLLENKAIIRNRQKIDAVINNAQATIDLRAHGGLAKLIWSYKPAEDPPLDTEGNPPSQSKESAALAKELKGRGFRFVGPTTIFALFEAVGVVNTFPFRTIQNLSNTAQSR